MSECTVISGGHRLVLERRSSLKYPWVQGVLGLQVPPGELGAQGGVRYSRRCPRSAPGAPVLNTLAVGECVFKAAAVILGCLTTQMWWQCHMFLALTLHGVPQFLYVLIFFLFFLLDPASAALPLAVVAGECSPPLQPFVAEANQECLSSLAFPHAAK